jgi:hypothetical protein
MDERGRQFHDRDSLTHSLRGLLQDAPDRPLMVGALLRALGGRGTAVLIMMAAPFVLPVPLSGLSLPFGAGIVVLGLRLGFGMPLGLPGFLLRRPLPRPAVITRAVEGVVRPIENRLRPRLPFLFGTALHLLSGVASCGELTAPVSLLEDGAAGSASLALHQQ